MNQSVTPVIYQSQGTLTILSRSWNLVRSNLKPSLLMIAPSTLMNIAFFLLLSLISSQAFLTEATAINLSIRLLLLLASILFSIPTILVSTLSYLAMCRYFYLTIVSPRPPSIKACFTYLLRKWLPLGGLVLILGALMVGLVIANIIVFYLGILLVSFIVGILGASAATGETLFPKLMMMAFVLVTGFVLFAGLIVLGSLEAFLFSFPITSVATETENPGKNIWQHLKQAYQLLFRNFSKVVLFSLGLLIFSWLLLGVLVSPVYFWVMMESTRISLKTSLPFYIQAVLNLWSSLANMLIAPLIASAMALFWYDCKTRSQGLDLKLWLDRLKHNKENTPQPTS